MRSGSRGHGQSGFLQGYNIQGLGIAPSPYEVFSISVLMRLCATGYTVCKHVSKSLFYVISSGYIQHDTTCLFKPSTCPTQDRRISITFSALLFTFRSRVASAQFVSRNSSNKPSQLPRICPLLLQLPPGLCAVLSSGNTESSVLRAPSLFERFTTFFKPITVLIRDRRHSQSPSLPHNLPSDPKDNVDPSLLAKFIENNRQTSAGTSREALHRSFSSAQRPTMIPHHNSAEASIAAHKAQAQAAIDTVDAAMGEQEG